MPTITAMLLEIEKELDRLIEATRRKKKRFSDPQGPDGKDTEKNYYYGPLPQPRGINLSGDPLFGFDIEQSRPPNTENGGKGPGGCVRKGNDKFAQLEYLTCRCRNGDQDACRAAARLKSKG